MKVVMGSSGAATDTIRYDAKSLIRAAEARAQQYQTLGDGMRQLKQSFVQITALGPSFKGCGAEKIKAFYQAQETVVNAWLRLIEKQVAFLNGIADKISSFHNPFTPKYQFAGGNVPYNTINSKGLRAMLSRINGKNGITGDISKKGNKTSKGLNDTIDDVKEEAVGKNVSVGTIGKEAKKAEKIEEIREENTEKSIKVDKEDHSDLPTSHEAGNVELANGANFGSAEKLDSHFAKHSEEFGDAYSKVNEYLAGAKNVIKTGVKVQYNYNGELRTGYVRFMKNSSLINANGVPINSYAKFEFVGTNSLGEITTYHVESGKTFWKMMNNGKNVPAINPIE
ncbi:MAG: T7SS effector LXG polymorphic toxin [Sporolactobacillus sp.]